LHQGVANAPPMPLPQGMATTEVVRANTL